MPRRVADNHPGKPEPEDATAVQVLAPAPCAPAPWFPATSAIVPIRSRRGAFHTRLIGAGIFLELDMERSVIEFSRIIYLEANYLKHRDKNSPKMLQCGRKRQPGSGS